MTEQTLLAISDTLTVARNAQEGSMAIYYARGFSPVLMDVLTSEEMNELVEIWTEGLCRGCGEPIPSGVVLCNTCFQQECRERYVPWCRCEASR